jgi:hypothetical protein
MNCKPGDLAIVCRCGPHSSANLGAIVEVLRPAFGGEIVSGIKFRNPNALPSWIVEAKGRLLVWLNSEGTYLGQVSQRAMGDLYLRPIRPGDMEDETPTEVIQQLTEKA